VRDGMRCRLPPDGTASPDVSGKTIRSGERPLLAPPPVPCHASAVDLRAVRAQTGRPSRHAARSRGRRAAVVAALIFLLLPAGAGAHVQLTPDHVAPGTFTLFTVLSPNESAQPLTGLQLTIPQGLLIDSVADTPGFTTRVIEDPQHRIAGLSWQGGSVAPAHLALFSFSGTPRATGLLQLTGIQRFADGSTQLWHSPTVTAAAPGAKRDSLTLGLAAAALVLALLLAGALVALFARGRRAAT
jgi:hypothetical protein